jgi:hypothetical protein
MGHTVQVGSPRPVVQSEPEDSAGEPVTEQDASHARGKLLPWAIASTAVGVVGFAGFAAFGLLSKNRFNQLEADCAAGVCPPASQNDIDQGRTYQLLANVGLGVGIAGVATGAVLLILDRKQAARSATAPLQVNVGFRSVQLRGTF